MKRALIGYLLLHVLATPVIADGTALDDLKAKFAVTRNLEHFELDIRVTNSPGEGAQSGNGYNAHVTHWGHNTVTDLGYLALFTGEHCTILVDRRRLVMLYSRQRTLNDTGLDINQAALLELPKYNRNQRVANVKRVDDNIWEVESTSGLSQMVVSLSFGADDHLLHRVTYRHRPSSPGDSIVVADYAWNVAGPKKPSLVSEGRFVSQVGGQLVPSVEFQQYRLDRADTK